MRLPLGGGGRSSRRSRCGVLGIGRVVSARNRERSESRERRRRSEVRLLFHKSPSRRAGPREADGRDESAPRGRRPFTSSCARHLLIPISRVAACLEMRHGVSPKPGVAAKAFHETPSCALERTARRRGGRDPAADKRDSTRDLIRNPAGGEVSSRPAGAWCAVTAISCARAPARTANL